MSWPTRTTGTKTRRALVTFAVLALSVGLVPSRALARTPAATKPASLSAFEARVEQARQTLPTLIESAEATAARTRENPAMLINKPYALQSSFAEELVNRAGGLANAFPPEERMDLMSTHDVILLSARCWAEDADKVREMIAKYTRHGHLRILFASKAGMPADIKVDFLIDNGAPTGGREHAEINSLTNVLNGWLWCCEYTGALTRDGHYPGVLFAMAEKGATEHNEKLQASPKARTVLGTLDKTKAFKKGELAGVYLKRVDRLLADLSGEKTQGQIDKAADVIADHLSEGGTVGVATCTHFLLSEVMFNPRTPMKPFHAVWHSKEAFEKNLDKGDICVFVGYVGVATVNEDYLTPMREVGARIITSFVTDPKNPDNNAPDALAHIEQHWSPPDAEVKVPFPPGAMAPVSGIDQGLIYRMLEDRVLERLKKTQ